MAPDAAAHWPAPTLKSQKCWECEAPIAIFHVQRVGGTFDEDGKRTKERSYLVADARQATFGLTLAAERPEDLKPSGAVVALLRKYAAAPAMGPLMREDATGDWWVPLYVSRAETPQYWLQLAAASPPEIRFVDADGTILVRKSSQGTFTKRRALGRPLPTPELVGAEGGLTDQTATFARSESSAGTSAARGADGADGAPALAGQPALLPDFQREARDRIARRVKTMTKAVANLRKQGDPAAEAERLTRAARLLQANLHRVREGAFELEVEDEAAGGERVTLELDPEASPGQNLQAIWEKVKKLKRADTAVAKQTAQTAEGLATLTSDLERLRAGPMAQAEVEAILARHKLATVARPPGGGTSARRSTADPLPFRTFRPLAEAAPTAAGASKADTKGPRVLVGKSAQESDVMVKAAKANDWWLHAVGTTGSHVLIPAADCRGALDQALLRAAAILALHYSKNRDARRGEVYVTRRAQIKKRKGMAPGLWQVDQAETIFVAYDGDELKRCLDALEPAL
jgi:hypothetical protein